MRNLVTVSSEKHSFFIYSKDSNLSLFSLGLGVRHSLNIVRRNHLPYFINHRGKELQGSPYGCVQPKDLKPETTHKS